MKPTSSVEFITYRKGDLEGSPFYMDFYKINFTLKKEPSKLDGFFSIRS